MHSFWVVTEKFTTQLSPKNLPLSYHRGVENSVGHALQYPKGGFANYRHHAIRDTFLKDKICSNWAASWSAPSGNLWVIQPLLMMMRPDCILKRRDCERRDLKGHSLSAFSSTTLKSHSQGISMKLAAICSGAFFGYSGKLSLTNFNWRRIGFYPSAYSLNYYYYYYYGFVTISRGV